MDAMTSLKIASAAFVGSHLLMSHPLRRPVVALTGEGGFRVIYSLVSLVTFGWMIHAFQAMPATPPSSMVGDLGWGLASAVMWCASVLLAGSFFGNPALPMPTALAAAAARRTPVGVFAITRHPMMWSFALWGIVHIILWPTPENHIFAGAIVALALIGALGQDMKKSRLMGEAWLGWQRRTAFFPFVAQFTGRFGWHATWPGWGVLGIGTVLWLAMTWLHSPLGARMAAGIWRWL